MLVTTPGPSASPLVPSPLVTVTVSPSWTRPASAGDTLKTMSNAIGSATSTSVWFASTDAPNTALIRVTTPFKGARSVASCCARRAVTPADWAAARSAAAWPLSFCAKTPAWTSRIARAYARSAFASAAAALCAAASNGARSNSINASPLATACPATTKIRATRVCPGGASAAKRSGRGVTVPIALTSCGKGRTVATLVATPSTPGSRETSWPLLDPPPPHAAAIPANAILPQSRRFTARPEQQ